MKTCKYKGVVLHVRDDQAQRGDLAIADEHFRRDIYQTQLLGTILRPKTILDVGGHIGCFGICAKTVWPQARLLAYEPNGRSAELYRQNLRENNIGGTVETSAVSYEADKMLLADNVNWAGGGVVIRSEQELERFNCPYQVTDRDVRAVTLEDILSTHNWDCIDLLKLDCETAELEILRHMRDETVAKIGFIVGEYHFEGRGFAGWKELVRLRFPDWEVLPLGRPGVPIGNFAAGPADKIKELRWAMEGLGKALLSIQTPKGNYVTLSFTDGAKVETYGETPASYRIRFTDKDTGENIYDTIIQSNQWAAPNPRYYVRWHVTAEEDGALILEHTLDLAEEQVLVELTSRSLGDTVAWAPYANELRQKCGCQRVIVSTFWRNILESAYPDLEWYDADDCCAEDFYASYKVGTYDNDRHRNRENWRVIPLQKVAADILGLSYEEINPKVAHEEKRIRSTLEPYVAISEFSTFHGKLWLHPSGWQTVVDYLNSHGLKVMSVSKEPSVLKNIIPANGCPIEETIHNILHARFYIGVSSGPMWLAHALDVPAIVIGGFTLPYSEMTRCRRVVNLRACRGCYNDPDLPFERANWYWCPRKKKFECSTSITPEMVIAEIDKLLGKGTEKPMVEEDLAGIAFPIPQSYSYETDAQLSVPEIQTPTTSETDHPAVTERILYIAPHLSTGGMPQYLLRRVLQNLSEQHVVEVLEWNHISDSYTIQRRQLVELCNVCTLGAPQLERLQTIVERFKPTRIHLQEFSESFLPQDVIAWLYRQDRSYRLVETTHDSGFRFSQKRNWPDEVVAVNRYHQLRIQDANPNVPVTVVPYESQGGVRMRAAGLAGLDLSPSKVHILHVGLFTPNKNQGEIFEVARRLPDYQFHFVGNRADNFASYWKPLMDRQPTNCTVWGERMDVDTFYLCMDALLFPSHSELAPLVVEEALAWKMPVFMRNLPVYWGKYDDNPLVTYIDADIERTAAALKTSPHLPLIRPPITMRARPLR